MDTYADGRTVSQRRCGKAALVARWIARLYPEKKIRLADLGCADGAIPVALLASPAGGRITEAVGVTLLDYNDLVEKPAFEHPRFRRLVEDLERPLAGSLAGTLPELAPGSFDLVTATSFLHYLADPRAGLDNAWHLLAPGGYLVATVPAPLLLRLRARRRRRPNTRIRHALSLAEWWRMAAGRGWELVHAGRAQLTGLAFPPVRALESLLERTGLLRLVGTNLVLVLRKPEGACRARGVEPDKK